MSDGPGEHCQACGKEYLDVYSVPRNIWLLISPKKSDAGLLCPLCAIHALCSELAAAQERIATLEAALGEERANAESWHGQMKDREDVLLRVGERLAEAQREVKIAKLKSNQRHEFCPDHRDKQSHEQCLACQRAALRARVEILEREIRAVLDDPATDWPHHFIRLQAALDAQGAVR